MKEENLQKFFKQAKYSPDIELSGSIWNTIVARERSIFKLKLFSYIGVALSSLIGFVFVLKDLAYQFTQSGFYEYSSLFFSDMKSVILYWKEFTLSLMDSLPVTGLIISLCLLFIIFISVRNIMNQFKNQLMLAY
jgi:hypothetical protein